MHHPQLPSNRRNCINCRQRHAAILICVLVVLLIVGALSAQTIQTLLIVRQADRQRSTLQQTQALVELGRLTLAQDRVPENSQIELSVDGAPALIKIVRLETIQTSTETQAAEPTTLVRYRIIATYAHGSAKEVTATWESPK